MGSSLYLEDVAGPRADVRRAARQLGGWQADAAIPDVPWLGGHQLAQRVEAATVDWTGLDVDARARRLWAARHELVATLAGGPCVVAWRLPP